MWQMTYVSQYPAAIIKQKEAQKVKESDLRLQSR